MGVFKARNKWRAVVCLGGKNLTSKSGFLTKKDAQKWHDKAKANFHENPEMVVKESTYTFDQLLKKFRETRINEVKVETRRRYEIDLKYRIEPFFKFYKLKNINSKILESFKSSLKEGSSSPKTINHRLALLNMILNFGYEMEMLTRPSYKLKMLKIDRRGQFYNYPWWDNPQDIQKFLQVAKERSRYYPAFLLALETGMRLGEIVGLCKQDAGFTAGRISVHRQWHEKQKAYGSTKNSTQRFIDFDPEGILGKALREAIKSSPDPEVIFTTSKGLRVLPSSMARDTFKRLIKRAGVPDICFHGLRHTFASWYVIKFDDFRSLQYILGHTDSHTTQRYAHLSKRHKRNPLDLSQMLIRQDPNVVPMLAGSTQASGAPIGADQKKHGSS